MRSTQYTCDGCGAEKREANHWIAARVTATAPAGILVFPFSDSAGDDEHYCGQACLIRRVSEFIGCLPSMKTGDELGSAPRLKYS